MLTTQSADLGSLMPNEFWCFGIVWSFELSSVNLHTRLSNLRIDRNLAGPNHWQCEPGVQ